MELYSEKASGRGHKLQHVRFQFSIGQKKSQRGWLNIGLREGDWQVVEYLILEVHRKDWTRP